MLNIAVSDDQEALEHLLDYDGMVYVLRDGYWLKFAIRRVPVSPHRPHGIDYAFTMHAPTNERIFGLDNDHAVPHPGGRHVAPPVEYDHLHRDEHDRGRPYRYSSAVALVEDFFDGVQRRLRELGLGPIEITEIRR